MYKIISKGGNNEIGPKATNLIKLYNQGLCPSFVVLDNSIFMQHVGNIKDLNADEITTRILANKLDRKAIREIRKALSSWCADKLIVRSSCLFEDSKSHSYAGLFDSFTCSENNIEESVKKVWLSQFSRRIKAYNEAHNLKLKIGMAVIIQEYIDPDIGGVIFYKKETDELAIEYSYGSSENVQLGKSTPLFLLARHGVIISNKLKEKKDVVRKVVDIQKYIDELQKFSFSDFDIEFIIRKRKISFVQIRPLTKDIKITYDVLLNDSNNVRFSGEDLSVRAINLLLTRLDIRTKIKNLKVTCGEIFVPYIWYESLIEELRLKTQKVSFVSSFYRKAVGFQKKQISFSNRFIGQDKEYIFWLKKYYLTTFFIDKLINFLISILVRMVQVKYNLTQQRNPEIFRPHKLSLTSLNLIHHLEHGKGLWGHQLAKEPHLYIRDALNTAKANISRYSIQEDKRNEVINLRRLLWLHDANDFFIDVVSQAYQKKVTCLPNGKSVSDLCEISFKELRSLSLGEILKREIKHKKISKDECTLDFPLFGVVASPGDFSGTAKIVKSINDVKNLKSDDIIVANQTTPSFVIVMAMCKGIITEEGGLFSHAAIVSRELGKPCIVGVSECLDLIKEGDYLIVSGNQVFRGKKEGTVKSGQFSGLCLWIPLLDMAKFSHPPFPQYAMLVNELSQSLGFNAIDLYPQMKKIFELFKKQKLDSSRRKKIIEEIKQKILDLDPDVLIFSLSPISNLLISIELVKEIRQLRDTPIIIHSFYLSNVMVETIYKLVGRLNIFFTFTRKDTLTLIERLKKGQEGKSQAFLLKNIQPEMPRIFDYEAFENFNMENYNNKALISSSVGCTYNCRFCLNNHSVLKMDYGLSYLKKQVEHLQSLYKINSIKLKDCTLNHKNTKDKNIINFLKSFDFTVDLHTRVDQLSRNIITGLEGKNIRIFTGIESIIPKTVEFYLKSQRPKEYVALAKKMISFVQERDIRFTFSFIFGAPIETIKDMNYTLNFITDIKKWNIFIDAYPLQIKPSTLLYKSYISKKIDIFSTKEYLGKSEPYGFFRGIKNILGMSNIIPSKENFGISFPGFITKNNFITDGLLFQKLDGIFHDIEQLNKNF